MIHVIRSIHANKSCLINNYHNGHGASRLLIIYCLEMLELLSIYPPHKMSSEISSLVSSNSVESKVYASHLEPLLFSFWHLDLKGI